MMRRHCKQSNLERLEEYRAENDELPRNRGQMSNFLYSVRNWTLFYFSLFALLTIVCQSVLSVILVIQTISWMIYLILLSTMFQECRKAVGQEFATINYGLIYGFCVSFLLSSSNTLAPVPYSRYSRIFFRLKPCQKMEQIMHELRYETKLPADLPYDDRKRPLQAMGLDNSYMLQFKEALEVHFDRYSRNETETFAYVKHLNLIGNMFGDNGAGYLLTALNHPHAYTEDLLLGRNLNLGDKTATELSMLIQSQKTLPPLTWLEFGGTAVTASGLKQLYSAVGETFSERPSFSYMGFEYTDKMFWPWMSNPVPKSISDLHQAKFLEEISLTGNMLDDNDMTELVKNILQTNITKLGLINNRIGAKGVERLLPLTKHLRELQLGINWRIGDAGAILLADALKDPNNNTTLESLFLFNCRVGQAGADAFLSIFPQNKKLKYLSLDHGRHIRKETLQAIEKATSENWKYH